ncbi:MAG: sulfurtransferase [Ktedonobacterales bacterium]
MKYSTLIDASDALAHLQDPAWAFIDCRFVLDAPAKGREAYHAQHIPGAVYADLEVDLSGTVESGRTGRHPLPSAAEFDATISRLGIDEQTQVVAYDELSGALAAARLWWLLKWAGHDAVAVLNGGLTQWRAQGYPVAQGTEQRPSRHFVGRYRADMVVSAQDVLSSLASGDHMLVDSRTRDRYRGEQEHLDPIAGHIPGAVCLPYAENVLPGGLFLEPAQLQARFEALSQHTGPRSTVFYCGSGVTAAQNVLAYAHAGLGVPKLYPGSWSDWITVPARPVATGDENPS